MVGIANEYKFYSPTGVLLTCPECGDQMTLELTREEVENLRRWEKWEILLQDALPDRDRTIRERFITGFCAKCYNRICSGSAIEQSGRYVKLGNCYPGSGLYFKYLVNVTLTDKSVIAAEVWANSKEDAINEAVSHLVGTVDNLPVGPYGEYLDAKKAGFGEPVYELKCMYVILKAAVSAARILKG